MHANHRECAQMTFHYEQVLLAAIRGDWRTFAAIPLSSGLLLNRPLFNPATRKMPHRKLN
jgi:hypothetical protein